MDDFNPYTAPVAKVSTGSLRDDATEGDGVWQDGKVLVMAKEALLPSRCVQCNEPATNQLKRSLSWHNRLLYVMVIFPGLLFYVIVALIVRKTAKILVPLCDEHRAKRSQGILIAWICALTGMALWFAPLIGQESLFIFLALGGVVLFLFGLIFGSLRSQVVTPQKIDDTHVWLNKISPIYLASLPPLPGDPDPI